MLKYLLLTLLISLAIFSQTPQNFFASNSSQISESKNQSHWFLLDRSNRVEYLYFGEPGKKSSSTLIKKFDVNVGVPGKKPTPLPELLGKEYWIITEEFETPDNEETSPYFLKLNIPVTDNPPFGPTPYKECIYNSNESQIDFQKEQCNWDLPGFFGLHGIGGNNEKLTDDGSSGCIRHKDEDITYLFNLLDPSKEEIRYYIKA